MNPDEPMDLQVTTQYSYKEMPDGSLDWISWPGDQSRPPRDLAELRQRLTPTIVLGMRRIWPDGHEDRVAVLPDILPGDAPIEIAPAIPGYAWQMIDGVLRAVHTSTTV